ncbi:serine/threonine-protein kinase [Paraliomyxa miuraensis]|uniref:serine/threonine-protein kinase n=1 Tax=Paraliomyxa miuraensis TaxID=376150 RepID=UPI002257366F|nr:serine/threonine-protein kinase [Paraliomyxa miuraensis]MCX4247343.1 tetratricopeptide repeat-containing serine/threonine protein kinase [Paraliomyxa miuraensis]
MPDLDRSRVTTHGSEKAEAAESDSGSSPDVLRVRMAAQKNEVQARLFGGASEPSRIGRYAVLDTLGQGGMGRVLRAHDETLDREVALKVLHDQYGGRHEQRLLREAQALARLTHPNVVRVYDVDQIDGRVCMAMELIAGQPLDVWQRTPHSWAEVLGVYRQAGRGLAAAHAQGLVHRDFKPSNCILDERRVVKVLDFGLARGMGSEDSRATTEAEQTLADEPSPSRSGSARVSGSQRMLEQDLTRTGTVLGTLAYMAPEQLLGRPATPQSDQFAFCVSLFEALYGHRPFAGSTAMALLVTMRAQQVTAPPTRRGLAPVPGWLFELVRRGLSLDGERRHPSMEVLLDGIDRRLARRRRARTAALTAAAAVGLGGVLSLLGQPASDPPCDGLREQVMPAWTDDERRAVRAAFEAFEVTDAQRVLPRVEAELDRYASSWVHARADACEATWIRHEAGEQALDRRMTCLDERLAPVQAVVERLASADARTVAQAMEAVGALPPLSPCADVDALLRSSSEVPSQHAQEGASIRALIARSWAAAATGDEEHGMEAADRAVMRAEALHDVPSLRADALRNRGQLRRRARRLADARSDLEAALALTDQLDDRGRAIDVLHALLLVANDEEDTTTASAWLAAIRGKLARPDGEPRHHALRWALEGLVALRAGRHEESVEANTRALALYDAIEEPLPDERLEVLLQLGDAQRGRKDPEAALAAYEQADALAVRAERIAWRVEVRYKLAKLHYVQGRLGEARVILEGSLGDHEKFWGPRSVVSARTRVLLATILLQQGDMAEALEMAKTAHECLDERSPSQIRGDVAMLLGNLHRAHGRWDEAASYYRETRAAWESSPSPDRVELAMLDGNIADCLVAQGKHDDAAPLYEQTLRILELDTPPDDIRRAYPLLGLGELSLATGEPQRAVPPLREVLALGEVLARDPALAATARWALARALTPVDTGARPSHEAVSLACRSQQAFAGAGVAEVVAQIDTWLEQYELTCNTR